MRKLKVGVVDILGKSASRKAYSRFMRANNQNIMPQVVAAWCAELGHEVSMAYYDGPEIMAGGLPDDADVVFISAFSHSAILAYALSAYYRSKGAVTVLGGPHARSYPHDSVQYFDYAVGFCDKELLGDILQDCAPYRPQGQFLSARQQPAHLPGLIQRWPFMEPILEQARIFKALPMLGSLGCPYTCSFCVDALVPYQPLDFTALKEDLRFILKQGLPRSMVVWHDPNFGIRFDDYLGAIEEAVPPGSLHFIAEMSLSLLKEDNVKRLARNGFEVLMPGVESWYDMGGKSKLRMTTGLEKVRRVAEHANMIMAHIPYLQTNFVFGLDSEEGQEPFELTKRFVDLAPGAYLYMTLLTSYGGSAPDNLRYQREGRLLNVPFHFLNTVHAINVRPKHYSWPQFFDHVCDVFAHTFSRKALYKRFTADGRRRPLMRIEQLIRGVSSGRNHRLRNMMALRQNLDDPATRRYFDGETTTLPACFVDPIRKDLAWLWEWLPEGAIYHDPYAYLKSLNGAAQTEPAIRAGMATA